MIVTMKTLVIDALVELYFTLIPGLILILPFIIVGVVISGLDKVFTILGG